MQTRYLRFNDLVESGIVRNRVTLKRWVQNHGFPPGVLLGPNSRAWREDDIEAWLAARAEETV
jgi:predicted DNA-binding transcriptional regulator AlpA